MKLLGFPSRWKFKKFENDTNELSAKETRDWLGCQKLLLYCLNFKIWFRPSSYRDFRETGRCNVRARRDVSKPFQFQ